MCVKHYRSPFFPVLLLVPCTPNIGSVVLDCFTNSAVLDWTHSEGALSYTATAQSSGGHVSTCSSNSTNCELPDLRCGRTYHVVTVASNEKCSSPPSSSLQVESGETCGNEHKSRAAGCLLSSARGAVRGYLPCSMADRNPLVPIPSPNQLATTAPNQIYHYL